MDLLCFVFTLCVLNGFMCYRYYIQNTPVVVHCVKILHNVQQPAYQYFIFIPLSATILYNTTYFSAGNYSVMY